MDYDLSVFFVIYGKVEKSKLLEKKLFIGLGWFIYENIVFLVLKIWFVENFLFFK